MSNAALFLWEYPRLARFQGSIWAPDARQLLLARKLGLISQLPSLTKDQLCDKSKGDALVKALAL